MINEKTNYVYKINHFSVVVKYLIMYLARYANVWLGKEVKHDI